jgi:ABC-2 type transport system ATP-binding protein
MTIQTHELSKRFRGNLVVDNLNFEVPPGGVYGLVGPNGAGKSTTIKLLMNLHRPTAGWSEVLGADSRRLSPREFARIGYVSEDTELPGWMTVGYFLDYLKPFYPSWDSALAAELVRTLDLPTGRRIREHHSDFLPRPCRS